MAHLHSNQTRKCAKRCNKKRGIKNKRRVKKQNKNRQEKNKDLRSSRRRESSASIKEQVGATNVTAFLAVSVSVSEYGLVTYQAHRLVVNVISSL